MYKKCLKPMQNLNKLKYKVKFEEITCIIVPFRGSRAS